MKTPIDFDEYYKHGAPGSYAHMFTTEAQAAMDVELQEKFASGQGVIALQPDMPDVVLLAVLKFAIEHSDGKPFLVVSPTNEC